MTTPSSPTPASEPSAPTPASEASTPTPASATEPTPRTTTSWLRDHSELGVCALLLALGVLVLADALTMDVDITQRGPVGPKTVPVVVGIGLLLVAALLAVDVLRGGRGQAETGEDVDLTEPADRRTVTLLTGVFLGSAVLIEPLGFPAAGALLFWGAAYALGSRRVDRDPLIAAVLSLATYALFDKLLGVPLPGGPLMGVL